VNLNDPRARRTRSSLKGALLELANEEQLSDITISKVAKRADVNRATVYLHYPDLDSLLIDAMEDAVAEVVRTASLCPLDGRGDSAPEQLVTLFTHISRHATLYARALGPHGSAPFAVRMREKLAAALLERFEVGARPSGFETVPAEVHAAYLAGALLGVIAQWITSEAPDSPEDIGRATWQLLRVRGGAADGPPRRR